MTRAHGLIAPFRVHGFLSVFVSNWFSFGGTILGIVAISWLAYELTSSALAPAVVVGSVTGAGVVLGLPGGAIADRFDRRAVLLWTNGAEALVLLAFAIYLIGRPAPLPLLVSVGLILGAFHALRTPSIQALVFDSMEGRDAGSAIALMNLGRPTASLAAPAVGFVLKDGSPYQAMLVLSAFFAAALLAALVSPVQGGPAASARGQGGDSLVGRLPRGVIWLTAVTAAIEMFGFSSLILLPAFARDVYGTSAVGLGAFHAVRGAGAIGGLLLLVLAPAIMQRRRALPALAAFFGLSLVAFSQTRTLVAALVISLAIGVSQGVFDTLLQVMLERSVMRRDRGSAIGLWVFGVGFGPLGYVELGFLANLAGVRVAQALNGAVLIVVAALSYGIQAPPPSEVSRRREPTTNDDLRRTDIGG